MRQGKLGFYDANGRYGVLCMDLWEDEEFIVESISRCL